MLCIVSIRLADGQLTTPVGIELMAFSQSPIGLTAPVFYANYTSMNRFTTTADDA